VQTGRNVPISGDDESVIPDGLHPNKEGHRIYGEYLVNELKNIL